MTGIFENTLIRCSAIGLVMTEPRGKSNRELYDDAFEKLGIEQEKYNAMPNKNLKTASNKMVKILSLTDKVAELAEIKDEEQLSETCKSFLVQTYALERFRRTKEVTTPQMVKGILVEDDSIDLFGQITDTKYTKNTVRLRNEFIAGTPDLFDGEDILASTQVFDIKSSWDIVTFLSNLDGPINSMYYWQLQGYMALTGANIGTIAYCLVNTPEVLLNDEKRKLFYRMDVATEENPKYLLAAAQLEYNLTFNDIPKELRLLTFQVDRNDEEICRVYQKVIKCRQYLAEFAERHEHFTKMHRKHSFLSSIEKLSEVE
jgi:hypothetical protein